MFNGMFDGLSILGAILGITQVFKEIAEPTLPANARFDYEAEQRDIENGISFKDRMRKHERGEYMTTKPKPKEWYELPMDTVVDIKRYQHDKEVYGEAIAEIWKKQGSYRVIR